VVTISEANYTTLSGEMHAAATAINKREQLIELAATLIEANLTTAGGYYRLMLTGG
jgi:hypothetical protein